MRAASLFAGIGGFDLAAQRLGVDVEMQAEIDPSAARVLRAQFPESRLEADATKVDLGDVDLVMAGFPCQGLSAAASTPRGQGLLDPESPSAVVWAALARVFRARPRYLLLENADSLGTARYADDMRALLQALTTNGYHMHVFALNGGCYGSLMRRSRTFVLARRSPWPKPETGRGLAWTCAVEAIGVNNQQGGALFCCQPSVTKKAATYTLMVTPTEVRSLTPEAVETLFGYPLGWTALAGSQSARYQRLGNSVSVDAATAALSLLLHGEATLRPPTTSYADLYPLTVAAGGGAAGSAFGRILRTSAGGARNPNTNALELEYCAPVYEAWMQQHPDDVSEAMWGYLEALRPVLRRHLEYPKAWPATARVEMIQRG